MQIETVTFTPAQRKKRLTHLEGVVKQGLKAYEEVGAALEEIRERHLYTPDYDSFERYCEARGMTKRHADRIIRAASTAAALRPKGLEIGNEAQAREMSRLMDDQETAVRVWREVGESNNGKHTAEALREAIDRELGVERQMDVHYSSASPEWYTPAEVVERVERALGGKIDLDPCADKDKGVPAETHYTQEDDGLSKEWRGRVFMNPPYGQHIGGWVEKLVAEHKSGRVPAAVALLPARTDTRWYGLLRGYPRCFLKGRVRFGRAENSAPFPSVAVYLGKDASAFVAAFEDAGEVYVRWRGDVDPFLAEAEEHLEPGEIGRAIQGYTGVRTGAHGEYIDPDVMRRASSNRAKRLHNEDDLRRRIDALPHVEETGIEDIEILHGEFQKVLDGKVGDASVDLVLTDPPYASGPDTRRLWEDLGVFSKRVLKPDGFLVAYMGTDDTAEELERVRKSVPWWWQIVVVHDESDTSHDRMFYRNYKPINVFGRVADRLKKRGKTLVSLRKGSGRDKTYHEWGQPVEEAIRLINELTEPGELVVDPFLGGGTTAVAAMRTGRRCIAAEKEDRHYRVAMDRVITESGTRSYGDGADFEAAARRRAEPRSERVRRAITGLGPNVVVLRPRDLPGREAS